MMTSTMKESGNCELYTIIESILKQLCNQQPEITPKPRDRLVHSREWGYIAHDRNN